MRKRGKNKGFTLIEVIIALAILAVALAPLIANFIVSSKMNLKSRKSLNAMNLAQDMMEGMRAYSAAEIIEKLDAADPSGPTPVTLENTLLPMGTNYTGWAKIATNNYTIFGVQTAAGKGNDKTNMYDVDVKLIPDTAVYDGKDMAAISTVDQYWNPVYTMSDSDGGSAGETIAIDKIYEKVKDNASGKTTTQLKANMQREIKLNMKMTTDSLGNNAYSTTVEVVYSIKPGNYADWHIDASNPSSLNNAVYTQGPRNISKAAASDCPTAVYLYYTGLSWANYTGDNNNNDTITITNQTGQDITVYLIRMQVESDGTANAPYNNIYGCRVNLEARNTTDGNFLTDITDPGWISLVTNVRYHLTYGEELNKRNRTEDSPNNILPAGTNSYYNRERADIYYNSITSPIDDENMYKKYVSDGYQKSDQGLLYKVKLTIRDSNTGDVMATYDGGTVN